MTRTIKVGDVVRMNRAFLQTLDTDERRRESRRRYTVKAIMYYGDTILVDFVTTHRQTCTGTAASWLEIVHA